MQVTLADRITLARLVLAPLAVAAYLLLPLPWCWWVCASVCGLAELTDWLDGKVARARGEVSDFGKLADPFCDVLYRMAVFMALLLPAGGVGIALESDETWGQSIFLIPGSDGQIQWLGAGLVPWFPVFLMVLREIVAGALRAMCATKGLVLAARTSGKVKAWLQGTALILPLGVAAVFDPGAEIILPLAAVLAWICAVVSVGSILEYIWVNRSTLRELVAARRS